MNFRVGPRHNTQRGKAQLKSKEFRIQFFEKFQTIELIVKALDSWTLNT